ncbi:MAG: hypothetical protein A2776_00805 [Candidatus Levybacteria bacterium RIFCSPHIGHO2_01_FULL_40_10]|nr:MAG: hypothetical protein A2776_00805 [Candidatus Levybacteria bacterium RIFCSPHIGHO2_01_FULL_40_10]
MAELMAKSSSSFQVLQKGQAVTGRIKKLTNTEILMDIGAKGDALVIEYDRQNLENLMSFLKVGDEVTATVISPESEEGFPVLSLRRALDERIFKRFEELVRNEEAFEVEILEATRGGYYAATSEGIKGFLPSSQVEANQEDLVGKKIQVKLLEADRVKKRVVFSQKAINFTTNPDAIKKYLKSGDVVEAEVATVTPYGMYVVIVPQKDIKIEGFIHISEVSHDRVEDLMSKFKTGDTLSAQVTDVDGMNRRVNLSIKKTLKDAFTQVAEKFKKEDKVKGKVKEIKSRGVTVELSDGINGFITSDKIPAGIIYEAGQEVTAEVVDIDSRRRLVMLSPVLKAVPVGYR